MSTPYLNYQTFVNPTKAPLVSVSTNCRRRFLYKFPSYLSVERLATGMRAEDFEREFCLTLPFSIYLKNHQTDEEAIITFNN
jgi:hypothetical protein